MQILCYKDSLDIITWTRGTWETPGEYTNPLFACVQLDWPEDEQPVSVDALGEPTPITVAGEQGSVYLSATVTLEPAQEVV